MSDIKIGLIGGSGLGAVLSGTEGTRHDLDTPFGKPSDTIIETNWHGLPVFFLNRHGPGHLLNPSNVPYRANLFALKQLGVTHIIASGAVGSLREEFKPRDLVIPDQIIDKTHRRAGTFFEKAAVHVEFAEPFCPVLRRILLEAAGESAPSPDATYSIHTRGCYVTMEGPAFSTRAEALMHRLWGGDLIGMTAMPEAKLAREAEISYASVSLVTDYDCWRAHGTGDAKPDPFALLNEIMGNLKTATDNAIALIRKTVEKIAQNPDAVRDCPAHQALKLAIWSDKNRISTEDRELLAPLWLKYFT
jgi:5'-methylthioadenosine phosphorylase